MQPIRIRFGSSLRAHQGKLISGEGPGTEVHAGTFLKQREIVLDSALLAAPGELARILSHELFHFVWARLGNPERRSYEALLADEMEHGARGELGWSAEWRKQELSARDRTRRTRRWREYVSESFCDTAGWLFGGAGRRQECTLPAVFRRHRRLWFRRTKGLRRISV